ncbi:hypothetical protein C3747_68g168 [Trypanosoma cruzi]|uniref:C2HC/C3H-type domain-containing protein n=2 Tax=Trypanosoma cruzi TaxID=5693 RepID=Q4DWN4_TRYCC|nr:hypothetical protein, conserved [Trypanosoma cruzi]EAN96926.1 hypothetical protein, conserved [Trypanosoma cruzi]PWV10516.1 hypothetical protein C3747_68g168 [Trypanosoma cruzi]RNC61402.1 hypothetical protein TcCL_ESM00908 [Trypanosoma cruzi]|eukprot:XP_818777.1 hypothetical protein [Trypanosoma cruzi strain CL Brener]
MNSKHIDKGGSSSLHALTPRTARGANTRTSPEAATPRTARGANTRTSPEAATPRGGSGPVPNLIVARGLYKVLEEVMHDRPPSTKQKNSQGSGQNSRPNFLFCYLCGMQFGSASLRIHQPQCHLKKLIEWERMDPARRGPRPVDPETHEKEMKERVALGGTAGGRGRSGKLKGSEIDRFNEAQIQDFNANMLVKCENCGRTFLPDRLEVHLRSCKPGAASASRPVARALAGKTAGDKGLVRAQSASAGAFPSKKSRQPIPLEKEPSTPLASSAARTKGAREVVFSTQTKRAAWGNAEDSEPLEKDSPEAIPQCANPTISTQGVTCDRDDGDGVVVVAEAACDGAASAASSAFGATRSVSRSLAERTATKLVAYEEAAPRTAVDVGEEKNDTQKEVNDTNKHCAASSGSKDERKSESLPVEEDASAIDDDGRDDAPAAPVATAAHIASAPAASPPFDDSQALDDTTPPERHAVKIPLNNVSRFKNVASRVHAGVHKKEELPRCRFCNRTFNANRLAKHEEVCLERNKSNHRNSASAGHHPETAPAAHEEKRRNARDRPWEAHTGSGLKKQVLLEEMPPAAPPAPGDVAEKSVPSHPQRKKETEAGNGSTEGTKMRFCFECGAKLIAGKQRFCAECGTKLQS